MQDLPAGSSVSSGEEMKLSIHDSQLALTFSIYSTIFPSKNMTKRPAAIS
jgi:hypothetical protein